MDMKPHNILLGDSLEAVVMDLGSAGPSDVHITSRSLSSLLHCPELASRLCMHCSVHAIALYCAVLCCAVLCCAVLHYTTLRPTRGCASLLCYFNCL